MRPSTPATSSVLPASSSTRRRPARPCPCPTPATSDGPICPSSAIPRRCRPPTTSSWRAPTAAACISTSSTSSTSWPTSSTAAGGAVDDVGQLVDDVLDVLMQAAAVGALHDEVVGGRHLLGIADDGQIGPSDVAGVGQAQGCAARCLVQHDAGGTEDVAGVVGFIAQGAGQLERLVVGHGAEQGEGALGIRRGIERLHDAVAVVLEIGKASCRERV